MLALYISTLLVSLFLALIVFLNNPRARINQFYCLFTLAASLWLTGVLNDQLPDALVLHHLRIVWVFAFMMLYFLFELSFELAGGIARNVERKIFLTVFLPLGLASLLTPLVTKSVILNVEGARQIERGVLYPVALLAVLFWILWSVIVIYRRLKKTISASEKKQLLFVFKGLAIAVFIAIVTNILLPVVYGSTLYNNFAPISLLVVSVTFAYAITRHGFLDIRLLIARSVAYIMSLAVMILIFILMVYGFLFGILDNEIEFGRLIFFFILTLVIAFIYQPLKLFFDKSTSSIFYRDGYTVQNELEKLSEIFVADYQIDKLIVNSMQSIGGSLRPAQIKMILLDSSGEFYDEYVTQKKLELDSSMALRYLSGQRDVVLSIDAYNTRIEEGSAAEQSRTARFLKKHGVALSVKLSTRDEVVGYMLMGPKLSGNIYSKKDLQFIGTAAKELAIAIQNARRFDEIQRFNDTLKLEVERATAELRRSNEKLQELDLAKDEFITMASHQLRTPLTSVKGYVSMVIEGDAGKITPRQKELLTAAFSSSQRMVYLISDLLNVSRLRTGKFVIDPKRVNLPDIVQAEIEQLRETAKNRNVSIVFKEPKDFPEVMLDETKIRQVMMNFIDNAIYYTGSGRKIVIELTANTRKIEFKVIDNGIGVPKEEQHNLFTKFYRAGNARKARPDGTGLGLFMAKRVIADQGGAIIFHSEENKGSTFGFSFPLKKIRPPRGKASKNK